MAKTHIGRNINVSTIVDHSIVEINSLTPTIIAPSREGRVTFSACLEPGVFDVDVFIRYYPAAQDDIKQGRDTLIRQTTGNDTLFRPLHEMLTDNVYEGEISAMTLSGTAKLLITDG